MFRTSIVGIDNTGKTSIVKSFENDDCLKAIHLTTYEKSSSKVTRIVGNFVTNLALFGERNNLKTFTGFAYLLHLIPYFIEQRHKKSCPLLLSDRDPIVDTLVYSKIYLPKFFFEFTRKPLQFTLEHVFHYPDLLIFLEVSPAVSFKRSKKGSQLHQKVEVLEQLKRIFDEEIMRIEKKRIKVVRINTEENSIKEVVNKIKDHLNRKK